MAGRQWLEFHAGGADANRVAASRGGVTSASPSTSTTCKGKVYDFFVASQNFPHNIVKIKTVPNAGYNPHAAVRLLLEGRSTVAMLRQVDGH